MFTADHFQRANRWVKRVVSGVEAIHQGLWLGLLSRAELQHITTRHYMEQRRYQNPDYNLSGFFPWEEAAVAQYYGECRSILVGAAGGGREVVALLRTGIEVEAFECSTPLLESARQAVAEQGFSARLELSRPDEVPEQLGEHDGFLMGLGAYMHIAGRETRIEFLRRVRQHVRTGGPILVSFFTRREKNFRFRMIATAARAAQPFAGRSYRAEVGDSLGGRFDHYFSETELANEFSEAGFELQFFSDQDFGRAIGRAM